MGGAARTTRESDQSRPQSPLPDHRDVPSAVHERYSAASKQTEPGLCCPIEYDSQYLQVIPREVLERDYGCGDPVSYVRPGETVLDLGSGGGKVCFIAAQIVGAHGQVIGIDINDDMLELARSAQGTVAHRIRFSNVTFLKARIEDLGLDLDFIDEHLSRHPVTSSADLLSLEILAGQLRTSSPLVADRSVDVVISNCVLNLVSATQKRRAFAEIARVLRPGGRAVISDIVADQDVPLTLQTDPDLWSGCHSGAMQQDRFLEAFVQAGLHGVTILKRDSKPWRTIEDVEFRSVTVAAYKAPESSSPAGARLAVLYDGPFASVTCDSGLRMPRGVPVTTTAEEFAALSHEPYRSHMRPLLAPGSAVHDPAHAIAAATVPALDPEHAAQSPTEPAAPSCECGPTSSCSAPFDTIPT